MEGNKITISLVIPAYNEECYLARCLESVFRHVHSSLGEVIVVDNASIDRTAAIAADFKGVRVVREERKGVAYARQRGFEEATGDVIAYIDADTEMPAEWFPAIVSEFSRDERLVCLSGPYKYYDVSFFERFCTAVYWWCLALPSYLVIGYMTVGGNFAVRRSALVSVGGFNTGIAFYGDDTDTARRLHKIGKVKFKQSFIIYTSGRRFEGQGFFKTGVLYAANYLSEVLLRRPVTKRYKDFR